LSNICKTDLIAHVNLNILVFCSVAENNFSNGICFSVTLEALQCVGSYSQKVQTLRKIHCLWPCLKNLIHSFWMDKVYLL